MNKSYYSITPAEVRYNEDLCPNAKLLYGELTALSNEMGYCYASNSYFAKIYKVHKNTISLWIKALSDNGFIYCELLEGKAGFDRKIYIDHNKIKYTYKQKAEGGLNEITTPPQQKAEHNNTYNNTTNTRAFDTDFFFDTIWKLYPKRIGKRQAKRRFTASVKNEEDFKKINIALKTYLSSKEVSRGFLQYGSTWFNKWEDYVDYKEEKIDIFKERGIRDL